MPGEVLLEAPELGTDPDTRKVFKQETVSVEFALDAGVIQSTVGPNRYSPGDALVTGDTGDRWSVSRNRFDAKYRPEPPTLLGQAGRYRNVPVTVLAKRMSVAFTVARSAGGDVLRGDPGDWLVEYAPGDYGVVAQARFDKIYRQSA